MSNVSSWLRAFAVNSQAQEGGNGQASVESREEAQNKMQSGGIATKKAQRGKVWAL